MKRLLIDPVESIFLQVPRALIASIAMSALDIALLAALVELAGWPPLVAATVSYLAGGVGQYILSSRWVFANSPRNLAVGFTSFTVLSLVGLAITWVVMACLCDFWQMSYAAAKVAALGAAFAWNFLSRKYLIFTPSEPALELVKAAV